MRICVLGATGPTGLHVVTQALEKGYEVYAIVRDPLKLKQKHECLKVFKADIFDAESLGDIIEGSYAVVSCLGVFPSFSTISLYSDSMREVVKAMRSMGVKRLICITSWYTQQSDRESFMMKWIIKPLILGRILDDMYIMETYLETECQDLEYTVIRPPELSNKNKLDREILYTENALQVDEALHIIPRANVASFMIDSLTNEKHHKKIMAIGLKKDE